MTIESSLRSVLSQTYQNFHLYVVIDGATDRSSAVARVSSRAISVQRSLSSRTAVRRRRGIAALWKGKIGISLSNRYIAFLDADDEWLPNHLALQEMLIRSSQPEGMYATGFRRTDPADAAVDLIAAGAECSRIFRTFAHPSRVSIPCRSVAAPFHASASRMSADFRSRRIPTNADAFARVVPPSSWRSRSLQAGNYQGTVAGTEDGQAEFHRKRGRGELTCGA
jgi:glycosyltransferase involved in cell wall biosynthesis